MKLIFPKFEINTDDNVFQILVSNLGLSPGEMKKDRHHFKDDHDKRSIEILIDLITEYGHFDIDIAIETVNKLDPFLVINLIREMDFFGLPNNNVRELAVFVESKWKKYVPKTINDVSFGFLKSFFKVLDYGVIFVGVDDTKGEFIFYDFVNDIVYRDGTFRDDEKTKKLHDDFGFNPERTNYYVYLDINGNVETVMEYVKKSNGVVLYDFGDVFSDSAIKSVNFGNTGFRDNPLLSIKENEIYFDYDMNGKNVKIPHPSYIVDDIDVLLKMERTDMASLSDNERVAVMDNLVFIAKALGKKIEIKIRSLNRIKHGIFVDLKKIYYIPDPDFHTLNLFKVAKTEESVLMAFDITVKRKQEQETADGGIYYTYQEKTLVNFINIPLFE